MVHEGRVIVLGDANNVVVLAVLPGRVALVGKRRAIRQDRRVGGNAVGIRGNDRGHRGAVRLALCAGGDGAGSLVDDVRFRQLGGCRVDLAVDERDRDPFTPQAHVAGFAQVVVGKIRLVSCRDWVGGVRGAGRQRGGSRGERQGRGRDADQALRAVRACHHWRGSHPSSLRGAGERSLSDP